MSDRQHDHDEDQELRGRLQRIDPAARTPPSTDHELSMLVTRTLAADQRDQAPARPRRRWQLPAVAGSTAVAAAVIVTVALTSGSTPSRSTMAFPPAGGPAASCAPLTPQTLARADVAFEATVQNVQGSRVVLRRDRAFKGKVGEEIETTQQPDGSLVGPFRPGQRYLLALRDGAVLVCGESGPLTPQLSAAYDRAF